MNAVRRIALGRVGALALLLAGLFVGLARSQAPDTIDTPRDAFRSLAATDAEARDAARWLLRHAGLGWPVDSSGTPYTHADVWAVASRSRSYAVLCGAQAGVKTEGYPIGPARYALLDSTGTALWTRSDMPFLDLPAVSDQGITALIMPDGAEGRGRMARLRVEFVGRDGRQLGMVAWGDRIWGSCIFICQDEYAFSPDGGSFVIALNQARQDASPDSVSTHDQSTIYLVAIDGTIRAAVPVGNYIVRQLLFSGTGHLGYLARQGDLHFHGGPALPRVVGVLDEQGALLGQHDLPDADEAVLDCGTDSLFSFSPEFGIVAMDMRTGGLETGVAPEKLERLTRAADNSVSGAAMRILQSRRQFEPRTDSLRK